MQTDDLQWLVCSQSGTQRGDCQRYDGQTCAEHQVDHSGANQMDVQARVCASPESPQHHQRRCGAQPQVETPARRQATPVHAAGSPGETEQGKQAAGNQRRSSGFEVWWHGEGRRNSIIVVAFLGAFRRE
ncbi:MAG: hypothetical protein EBS91_03530 [Betaproteobacteria bacterium]|nr:hypothetical protein [Betaproteobacteria bacterium]